MDHVGRWLIPVLERADAPAFEAYFRDLAGVLADVAKDNQGTLAARPVSTPLNPGVPGRYWYVTGDPTPANNGRLYRDFGTGWIELRTGTATAAALTAQAVGEVGQVGQVRAGRPLTVADFTNMGLAVPLGLWNLADVTDSSGNARNLTNKGAVPFAPGILGVAGQAAQFAGSTAQVLYRVDAGAGDPFRIRTGSWGGWFRTAKRGIQQQILTKWGGVQQAFEVQVSASNQLIGYVSTNGGDNFSAAGITDVADDRWHLAVVTHDGTKLRLYLDGALEAQTAVTALIFAGSAPLNIGGSGADAATVATLPFYGRVDEGFVLSDVLTDEHVRNLYAAAIPHALGAVPSSARLAVRRRRRGAALVAGDFPATPLRLYNFPAGAVANEGSDANGAAGGTATLQANPGTGAIVDVAGPDGSPAAAKSFSGAHGGLSGTDTGLPAGTAARSYGGWFKAAGSINTTIIGWGTLNTGDVRLVITSTGAVAFTNAADSVVGPVANDGTWHHATVVEDNAAADGVKRKLYIDGRLAGGSTVLNAIVLAGANRFRIGANPDGTQPLVGQAARPFVYAGALTPEQVRTVYNKGATALAASPKSEGDHVEAMEATRLLVVLDALEAPDQVDVQVIA